MSSPKCSNQKCVKKNGNYRKVSNDTAFDLVRSQGWKYCSKTEFKNSK